MKKLQTESGDIYCNSCKKMVTFHYERVNHRKSLMLTLLTLGLWLPMWLIGTFAPTKICDVCKEAIWKE
jgi:hypothetical protein